MSYFPKAQQKLLALFLIIILLSLATTEKAVADSIGSAMALQPSRTQSKQLTANVNHFMAANDTDNADSDTYSLPVDQDSFLVSLNGDTDSTHGSWYSLISHQNATYNARPVVRYDISSLPPDAEIQSATAYFYVLNKSTDTFNVHRITDAWTEGTVTWESTATDYDPAIVTDFVPDTALSWIAVDITNLVRDWAAGVTLNHGIMIINPILGDYLELASNDILIPNLRPYLEVEIVEPTVLPASRDTWLSKDKANHNFGFCDTISLDTSGAADLGNGRPLVQFDLSGIPAGTVITSAQLQLTKIGGDTATHNVEAHKVLAAWDEGTGDCVGVDEMFANWDKRQSGVDWGDKGGDYDPIATDTVVISANGSYTWDMTSLVQSWVDDPIGNHGVILGTPDTRTDLYEFASREYGTPASRPQLIIDYAAIIPVPISGVVWEDQNRDGVRDGGETGLAAADVYLYDGPCGDTDYTLLQTQVTHSDGAYEFTMLEDGEYCVRVDEATLPADYVLTNGENPIQIDIASDPVHDVDFGYMDAFSDDRLTVGAYAPCMDNAWLINAATNHSAIFVNSDFNTCVFTLNGVSENLEELRQEIAADPQLRHHDHDVFTGTAFVPNDPDYSDPNLVYGPQQINAETAWDVTTGDPGMIVAILDSGVDLTHPEFSGRMLPGYDFVNDDADPTDDNGHGTHVAGVAVAGIDNGIGMAGMAGTASILPVKVLGANGFGWWSDVATGISWAVEQGAKVINLSLAGTVDSQAMRDAVAFADSKGVTVIVAAGNDSSEEIYYPASYDNAIAVGATTFTGIRWTSSNYGPNVDVLAPGSLVWSTSTGAGYQYLSGTSMAAPHAAGVAALLLSEDPNLTPNEVKAILQDTATDMGDPGVDALHGYGLINAGAALMAVNSMPPEPLVTSFEMVLAEDMNENGLVDPGDTLRYRVKAANNNASPLADVVIVSSVPVHTTYVPVSTILNGIPVLDNTSPASALPLDENGLNIGSVPAYSSSMITFDVVVQIPPSGVYAVYGKADVTSSLGSETMELETEVAGTVLQAEVDKASARPGDILTYTLTTDYLEDDLLQGVVITAPIPAGTTYVPGSANAGGTESGGIITWNLGSTQVGMPSMSHIVGHPESDLMGHWSFETDANDYSGNNYDGVLINGAFSDTTPDSNMVGAGKLSLDGVDDYVDLSAHKSDFETLSQGTLSAWIRTTDDHGSIVVMSDMADVNSFVALWIWSGRLNFSVSEDGNHLLDFLTNVDVTDGNWHHVAVTVDASGNKLFVDGVQVNVVYYHGSASTQGFFNSVSNIDFMAIGADQNVNGLRDSLGGLVDDVLIYDRALSASEIAQLAADSNDKSLGNSLSASPTMVTSDSSTSAASSSFNSTSASTPATLISAADNSQAVPSLVAESEEITVSMIITASEDVANVAPLLVFTGTNGVSANLLSGPTPDQATVGVVGTTYTWVYEATDNGQIGQLTFGGDATDGSFTWAWAESNSVIVHPPLTFQATVNDPPSVDHVQTTAFISDATNLLPSHASNTPINQLPATIGDRVWNDLDGDTIQDPTEMGIDNVTVDLTNSVGATITTVTGPEGFYDFTGLTAGTYTITVDSTSFPAAYDYITTAGSHVVTVANGEDYNAADFGFKVRPMGIGDTIWYDADGDGFQDMGEAGIGNITLDLWLDDGDGVFEPVPALDSDTFVGSTVANAAGAYSLEAPVAGDYFVDVTDDYHILGGLAHTIGLHSLSDPSPPISVAAGQVLQGVDFGYVKVPSNGYGIVGDLVWLDENNDGVRQMAESIAVGIEVCATPGGICTFTDLNGRYLLELPVGSYDIAPTTPPFDLTPTTDVPYVASIASGQKYLDADFGYDVSSSAYGSIGGSIWQDLPENDVWDGIYDPATEPGIPNVTTDVMKDVNANGIWDEGEPYSATISNLDGEYLFGKLLPGNYLVKVSDTLQVLRNFAPTESPPGASAPQDGSSKPQPYAVELEPGEVNTFGDFGYREYEASATGDPPNPGMIGDFVWHDQNGDGVYEPKDGDMPIPGVTLVLRSLNGDPDRSATTDLAGRYLFSDLSLTDYQVEVTDDFGALVGRLPVVGADSRSQPYETVLGLQNSDMTADFGYQFITPNYSISNVLVSNNPSRLHHDVTFEITITNAGNAWLAVVPLQLDYDPEYLAYTSPHASPASDDILDDGVITWRDLTLSFGEDLAPGEEFKVSVTFETLKDTTEPFLPPDGVTSITASNPNLWADPDGPGGSLNADIPVTEKSDDASIQIFNPTGLQMTEIQAVSDIYSVRINWQTLSELQVVGFNVLRSIDGGEYELLNQDIIVAEHAGTDQGMPYAYLDDTVVSGMTYQYMLEAVRTDGGVETFDLAPITAHWWLSLPFVMDN